MEQNSLKIYTWNAHSIYNKLSELRLLLYTKKPHLMCIQEVWHREGINPTFVNYRFLTNQRLNRQGGGTAVLLRSDLILLNDAIQAFPNGNLEQQFLKIKADNSSIDILNLYNPGKRIT